MGQLTNTAGNALFGTALFMFVIAAWGVWEYRERDLRHRKALLDLQSRLEPVNRRRPSWVNVITTAAVLLVLLIILNWGFNLTLGLVHSFYNPLGYLMYSTLAELTVVAFLFLAMVVRDIKILRRG